MVEHYGLDTSSATAPTRPIQSTHPEPEITRLERKIAELRQQATG